MLQVDAHYHTHQGHRTSNEDCAAVLADARVFAVSDGMGGTRGGGTASRIAVQTVQEEMESGALTRPADPHAACRRLRAIVRQANRKILTAALADAHLSGMGATLTVASLHGEYLVFAHVGDTRLYHWRDGACTQLTEDHTQTRELLDRGWISARQADTSAYRHVLVKYLGTPHNLEPQTGVHPLRAGDRVLLCSDGLYGEMDAETLNDLLGEDQGARALAEKMVSTVSNSTRSALDNITALVVRFEDS